MSFLDEQVYRGMQTYPPPSTFEIVEWTLQAEILCEDLINEVTHLRQAAESMKREREE
jgi:hypothetical protein